MVVLGRPRFQKLLRKVSVKFRSNLLLHIINQSIHETPYEDNNLPRQKFYSTISM